MRHLSLGVVTIIVLFSGHAFAQPFVQSQEGIALENQILQLQNQIQQLQGSNNSGGSVLGNGQSGSSSESNGSTGASSTPSGDLVANLLNQVSQLQSQVQQLSGRVDTLQNQVDTQHAAMEKEIGDLNFKLAGGTATGSPSAPAAPPASGQSATNQPAASSPSAVAKTSPQAALAAAQTALSHRNYQAAEANARSVLAQAKSGPDGYKAQFILAEALYGEGRPQDAAIAYDDSYNRARTGTYAPESLLGLANSLSAIHQQSAACDTLATLTSQFPSPEPSLASRIDAAKRRANCS
jgi:TolA-binding protein